jgi:hypothetical protein
MTLNREIFNLNPILLVILFSYNYYNNCHKYKMQKIFSQK